LTSAGCLWCNQRWKGGKLMVRRYGLAGIILLTLVVTGCDRPLVIYNGCAGSLIRVVDGRGSVLAENLPYGNDTSVDVRGYSGSTVELLATGSEVGTGYPLGSVSTSRYIPRSGGWGGITGPSQLEPWRINSLHGGRGCQSPGR